MKKFILLSAPFGMIGVIAYMAHIVIGQLLWPDYNWITTDISTLTAINAPNRELLLVFTTIYGIFMLIFVLGMIFKSFKDYNNPLKLGYCVLLLMNLVSIFGYNIFPLSEDKTIMNFNNMMHIVVTIIVVFTTITASYLLAYGYLKQEKSIKLGKFILVMAIIITITGALNPIAINNHLNILGLTERAVIFSLQIMIFYLSTYYTFNISGDKI